MNGDHSFQRGLDRAANTTSARWISAAEATTGSLIVIGHSIWNLLPNSLPILLVMGLISFRLRQGSWTAMGLGSPKSWPRAVLIAVAAVVVQQGLGQFVVDPLTHPFLHYSPGADPLKGTHGAVAVARWLGIIWTYAAFGEEVCYRGYLLNRIADFAGRSRAAVVIGLLWSSILFGLAHWYQGPAGVVSSAVSGIVFGSAYLLSRRNLWAPVLAHGFSDSLAVLAVQFGLTG